MNRTEIAVRMAEALIAAASRAQTQDPLMQMNLRDIPRRAVQLTNELEKELRDGGDSTPYLRLEKGVEERMVFIFTGLPTKLVDGRLQVTVNVIEHPNDLSCTRRLTIGLEKHLLCSYLQREENLTSAEDLDNFVQKLADDCQQMEYVQWADDTTVLREYRPC